MGLAGFNLRRRQLAEQAKQAEQAESAKPVSLENMNINELRIMAREQGIENVNSMKKADLINAISGGEVNG